MRCVLMTDVWTIDLPDLQNVINLALLSKWPGDWAYLPNVKFVRLGKGGARQESLFPPHGSS